MNQPDFEYKLDEILDILKKQNERIAKLEKQLPQNNKTEEDFSPEIPTFTPTKSTGTKVKEIEQDIVYESHPKENADIESEIGGKWLVKIGVLALLIGVGFFMKYAFENWIGPIGQIMFGYFLGLVVAGGGWYVRTKYQDKWKNYALTLTGGGIGICYITTFAAANYYSILNVYAALALVFIITVISALISIRSNSIELFAVSILGGFLSPLLLGVNRVVGADTVTLAYLITINIGVAYVSTIKSWKNVTLLAMLCSYLNLIIWKAVTADAGLTYTLTVYSIFFGLFTLNTIYRQFIHKKLSTVEDLGLLVLNAVIFYHLCTNQIGYGINTREYRALLSLILGGIYALLGYTSYILNKEDRNLMVFLTGLSITSIGLSVPLILNNRLITLGWIVESLVVLWIGFGIKDKYIRGISYVLFLIAIVRMIIMDLDLYIDSGIKYIPVFNPAFLELFACVMALYIGAYMFYQYRSTIEEKEFSFFKGIYVAAAQVITLVTITNEINFGMNYYLSKPLTFQESRSRSFLVDLVVSLWWLAYSYLTLAVGSIKKSYVLSKFTVILFCILILKVIILDIMVNGGDNISQSLTLSIIWTLAALVGIILGFYFTSKNYRLVSLLFLGTMIVKLFLFDTWSLSEIYRIISYFTLGVILIIAGYVYVKYQKKIKDVLL